MSFDLLSLPLLVLDTIFDYLPLWKIRQLACMCHDMINLKNRAFSRRRHLRLFGGTIYSKYLFIIKAQFYQINHDFDMNIRLEGETPVRPDLPHVIGTLSPDLHVRNAQQIGQLVRWFPSIRKLTLVVANKWPQDCQAQLFGLWPQIKSLKIVNISRANLDWPQVGPQLNALTQLEHFIFSPFYDEIHIAKDHLASLLESGRLKTFISTQDVSCEYKMFNGKQVVNRCRNVWNSSELVPAVEQLETFGVSEYIPSQETNFTNLRLLQKLKQIHVYSNCANSLRDFDLNGWTGLQSLSFKSDALSLKAVIANLGALPNLNQLYLEFSVRKIKIPSKQVCKRWPKLPSVRRFELYAICDPCRFTSLAHSFPNATQMSFQLGAEISDESVSGRQFVHQHRSLHSLCTECAGTVVRALDKFGSNIQQLLWFYNRNEAGAHELVSKVKLFTVEIDGQTRISLDYH